MSVTTLPAAVPVRSGTRRAGRELALLAVLYVGYGASRLLADDALGPAAARAGRLLAAEAWVGLDVERAVVDWTVGHPWLAAAASFHYATAHYLVTAAVLAWTYRRGPAVHVAARRVLVAATVAALVVFVLVPVAPPRLVGHPDVLALSADVGWWGAEASAPQGLGDLTNQLAAFPSMHAGWAAWVALVLGRHARTAWVRRLGVAHAVLTAVVVVATGNHWVVDVVVGCGLVLLAARLSPARGPGSSRR